MKKSYRYLSIILTLALILCMMPSVFASNYSLYTKNTTAVQPRFSAYLDLPSGNPKTVYVGSLDSGAFVDLNITINSQHIPISAQLIRQGGKENYINHTFEGAGTGYYYWQTTIAGEYYILFNNDNNYATTIYYTINKSDNNSN